MLGREADRRAVAESAFDRELALSLNASNANEVTRDAGNPQETQPWAQAHAGFLRAVLLIVAYCSAVISLISMIAFRGVQTVAVITGAICIVAVAAVFLLPRSRGSVR